MAAAAAPHSHSHHSHGPFRIHEKDLEHVYVLCNEQQQQETHEAIKQAAPRTAILGCSGFFVLDIASLRPEVTKVAVFDLSKRVAKFWEDMREIIVVSNYQTAKARIIDYVTKNHPTYIAEINESINNNLSWLSSAERFERIQKIFQAGNFSFTQLDLGNPERFEAFLAKHGQKPFYFYPSNILNVTTGGANHIPERYEGFKKSLSMVPKGTMTIYATNTPNEDTDTLQITEENPTAILMKSALFLNDYEKVAECINVFKANPNQRDKEDYTLLMTEVENERLNSVRALVEVGKVNVDETGVNQDGENVQSTALHIAADNDLPEMIRYLQSVGADLEAKDIDGRTPLMVAFSQGNTEAAKALIELGASLEGNESESLADLQGLESAEKKQKTSE